MPSEKVRGSATNGGREGKAPFWPPHISRIRDHDLCLLLQVSEKLWKVRWRDGSESQEFSTFDEFKALLWVHSDKGVDCFVGNFYADGRGFPFIEDAISDKSSTVRYSKTAGVTGISIRVRKKHISVGCLDHWFSNWSDRDEDMLLGTIDEAGDVTSTGSNISPGGLGATVMQRGWKGKGKYPRVSRVRSECLEMLKFYIIAGRVEDFLTHKVNHAFNYDLSGAYLSCCKWIPWGTSWVIGSRVGGFDFTAAHISARYRTWFCEVEVIVPRKLAISPIPIKTKPRGEWRWAREPGVYHTFMWREEVEAALRAGCFVNVRYGWGWKERSNRLQPYAEEMYRYRKEAQDNGFDLLAGVMKRATVAGIGRTGVDDYTYTMETHIRPGDELIVVQQKDGAPISELVVHKKKWKESASPKHIHAYILMRCRLRVYYRCLSELRDGNELFNVNFDGFTVNMKTMRPVGEGLGQWKETELHARDGRDLFPRSRWVDAVELQTMPGLPRDPIIREEYLGALSVDTKHSTGVPTAGNPSAQTAGSPPL